MVDPLLLLLQAVVSIYDIVSYPIYTIIQRPWQVRQKYASKRSQVVHKDEDSITIQANHKMSEPIQELIDAGIDTMEKCFKFGLNKHKQRRCIGTRQLLAEEDEIQHDGKVFKKWKMGNYRWNSYVDVDILSTYFGMGLRELGQKYKENLCIFADTRAEWMVAAQACFKQTFPVVTLYTNLGEDAIVHSINQTEVKIVITTHDLLPKFRQILLKTPKVNCIIFMEDQINETDRKNFRNDVKIIGYREVIEKGKVSQLHPTVPEPSDPAIIMFTSGSTGVPKGVVLPHSALMTTVRAFHLPVQPGDIYLGYLPLAHILELLAENAMMVMGVPIGYSSPNTLTDNSTKISKGGKGDCTVLKPTLMCAVPLILDRLRKGIEENVAKKGDLFKALFDYCLHYKQKWTQRGYRTPIMDALVFRSIQKLVGGQIRKMLSGGAPLSQETHEFIRATFSIPVVQGYGLTESCACACIMDDDDNSTRNCGPPLQGVQVKLVNWNEGGYKITDRPCPRGEIVIGGENVATGYYDLAEKTTEDFFTDANGLRWFKTGDIGQIEPTGQVKIVDRKKDLVKLQHGEYVSLGKVESELKACLIVENVCIYGDSTQNYVVALVVPNKVKLAAVAEKLSLKNMEHEELCNHKEVTKEVLRELQQHGKRLGLEKFELPGALTLCMEEWTPESGLVTAAFKLKRKPIQDYYQNDLKQMLLSTK